ncbi:MAG: error-prone DNA polymerase, partial [Hyphomicrobiales bacterium]|nr:error-prone DNA polymerase [Hyphomicrobiales bacterium]
GVANIIVWPKVLERFRPVVLGARLVRVAGRLQSESGVIHVVAQRLEDATPLLAGLSEESLLIESLANADEVRRPIEDMRAKVKPASRLGRLLKEEPELAGDLATLSRQARSVMPKGRNFH